jgi:hypothetical protein
VRGPSPTRLQKYASRTLGLASFLAAPGDGRTSPQIPASSLFWGLLICKILRVWAFHAVEQWVRLAPRALAVGKKFSDDTLRYYAERLDPEPLRDALAAVVQRAKRNKAFERAPRIGLVLDGSGVGHSTRRHCGLCHPQHNSEKEVVGYGHKVVAASVVGAGLVLPVDIEYYGPGQGELTAAKRVLPRVIQRLGRACADYLVLDGLYPGAPFLKLAGDLGLPVIASLTEKLPELVDAARRRFAHQAPTNCFQVGRDRVEVWDADDFEPWAGLHWASVRVLRYRHYRHDGKIFDAHWLTNFTLRQVGSRALFQLCKSRWSIENGVFNEAKNRYGLEHTPQHQPNSIVINALILFLALCLERLYRLRNLHRAGRPRYSAAQLHRVLMLSLGAPLHPDTS